MKKKFVGVQFVETVRVGKRTFAFGIYGDHKIGRVPFVGLSEKNPEDKRDNPTRGRNFAVGRAFENLGKQIEKQEWQKVKYKKKTLPAKPKLSEEEIAELRKNAKKNSKTSESKVETHIERRKKVTSRAAKTDNSK